MKALLKLLLLAFSLSWAFAQAATISYSDNGTFSAATTSDALGFSAPNETWAFSFQADSNPSVTNVGMGGFSFAFSNFSYSLDNSPVAITPSFIRFFSGTNGGGFLICFNGMTAGTCTDGLGTILFGNPQMYTGQTSAPTLSPGMFDLTGFGVAVNSTNYFLPDTTVVATIAMPMSIPEPATVLTLAAGFLALAGGRRHSHR
jgi:hypothetical protein